MSPTIHRKYFHSTVHTAEDRRRKFLVCGLPRAWSFLTSLIFTLRQQTKARTVNKCLMINYVLLVEDNFRSLLPSTRHIDKKRS